MKARYDLKKGIFLRIMKYVVQDSGALYYHDLENTKILNVVDVNLVPSKFNVML